MKPWPRLLSLEYNSAVRSQFSRIVVASILIICVICPLLEVFDRWDHTLQTGNDGEYTMVVLALCVGAMYSIARSAADVPRAEPDAEMKSELAPPNILGGVTIHYSLDFLDFSFR